jgi:hypothetical protein
VQKALKHYVRTKALALRREVVEFPVYILALLYVHINKAKKRKFAIAGYWAVANVLL